MMPGNYVQYTYYHAPRTKQQNSIMYYVRTYTTYVVWCACERERVILSFSFHLFSLFLLLHHHTSLSLSTPSPVLLSPSVQLGFYECIVRPRERERERERVREEEEEIQLIASVKFWSPTSFFISFCCLQRSAQRTRPARRERRRVWMLPDLSSPRVCLCRISVLCW